ncbi:MAG: SAM-dependent methyltransferase [Paludibacter sp.]|jgi:16S rRNA (cytidine1402-2'-O)-methyltransferase|nr:SAM-dependent methyltransferase [Paludibacter sp.]
MVLYLIPTSLGETDLDRILPAYNNEIVNRLDFFIVEDVRTARRFLKKINPATDIDSKTFYVLNQHTRTEEIAGFLKPLSEGREVGVISEAGCPAIADPGADVVAIAQEKGFKVVPLVGPSSILLALMASGFNGQSFAFNGYLPVQPADRTKAIKRLENRAHNEKQSQIFIETPYRNMKMLQDIISVCQPTTRLCIAADITLETEFIHTKTVNDWKKQLPDLNKRPCIFILY